MLPIYHNQYVLLYYSYLVLTTWDIIGTLISNRHTFIMVHQNNLIGCISFWLLGDALITCLAFRNESIKRALLLLSLRQVLPYTSLWLYNFTFRARHVAPYTSLWLYNFTFRARHVARHVSPRPLE